MFKAPLDLANSRIMISNDDGIRAPGIKVLEEIALTLSDDVQVCAPETEQSVKSHSLTVCDPLRLHKIDECHHCVSGTPTDAVLLGINYLFKDRKPDLMLSGINFGRNAGVDVTYSGTVAAAMEATLLGVPAIAFSQTIEGNAPNWDIARHYAPQIIRQLTSLAWPVGILMNVNFPNVPLADVKGIKIAHTATGKLSDEIIVREDRWGDPYFWVGHSVVGDDIADTDVAATNTGYISITPLHLDMTYYPMLDALRTEFTNDATAKQ